LPADPSSPGVIPARGKILVIRGGAIGDFILTLPVLAALRRHFPGSHLEILGYPQIARLALAGGLVDDVRSIDARPLARFFAHSDRLDEQFSDYFGGFAVILSYLYDPDRIFEQNVARCSKAQFIAGPHRPDDKLNLHATEVFLKPLERLAIFHADPVPRLRVGQAPRLQGRFKNAPNQGRGRPAPAESPSADTALGTSRPHPDLESALPRPPPLQSGTDRRDACPTLALHPGSGSERKNWPEERWGELICRLLIDTELGILLVGGEAEGDRLKRLAAPVPEARLQIAQSLSLVELAERLQHCVGFLGHDSGVTHLAAALGLPGLVLWGETNETVWRPRSERIILLRHPRGLSAIAAESVMEQLPRILSAARSGG
jgi:heptosyltransferase-3